MGSRPIVVCTYALMKGTGIHQPLIHLNVAFRSDLTWWHTFLEHWNGIAMLVAAQGRPPDYHLFTDASGALGCGAWSGHLWPEVFAERSIAVMELLPIVLACIVWGSSWRKQPILAHCDNNPEPLPYHGALTDCIAGGPHTEGDQCWGGCHILG